jgi:hypothetical protein
MSAICFNCGMGGAIPQAKEVLMHLHESLGFSTNSTIEHNNLAGSQDSDY